MAFSPKNIHSEMLFYMCTCEISWSTLEINLEIHIFKNYSLNNVRVKRMYVV